MSEEPCLSKHATANGANNSPSKHGVVPVNEQIDLYVNHTSEFQTQNTIKGIHRQPLRLYEFRLCFADITRRM